MESRKISHMDISVSTGTMDASAQHQPIDSDAVRGDQNDNLAEDAAANPDGTKGDEEASTCTSRKYEKSLERRRAAILKQVEFWFSADNIQSDSFLREQIQKAMPEGWVPLAILATFRKLKKLNHGGIDFIAEALRPSQHLEVSPDGTAVRAREPIQFQNANEIRSRMVVVDNLPDKPTIESIEETFKAAGDVVVVRIRQPGHPETLLSKQLRHEMVRRNRKYALVEYKTAEQAVNAVKTLNSKQDDWRSMGLRVRSLREKNPTRPEQQPSRKSTAAHHHHQRGGGARLGGDGSGIGSGSGSGPLNSDDSIARDVTEALDHILQLSDDPHHLHHRQHHRGQTTADDVAGNGEHALPSATTPPTNVSKHHRQHPNRPGAVFEKKKQKRRTKDEYAAWAIGGGGGASTSSGSPAQNHQLHNDTPANSGGGVLPAEGGKGGGALAGGTRGPPRMPDGSRGFHEASGVRRGVPTGPLAKLLLRGGDAEGRDEKGDGKRKCSGDVK